MIKNGGGIRKITANSRWESFMWFRKARAGFTAPQSDLSPNKSNQNKEEESEGNGEKGEKGEMLAF